MKASSSRITLAVLLFISLGARQVSACEAPIDTDAPNLPTKVGSQCSFEHAGLGNGLGGDKVTVFGLEAKNQGSEIVTQIITYSTYGCNGHQILLVADCEQPGVIGIEGVYPPFEEQIAGGNFSFAERAVGPNGRIRLLKNMSLTEMIEKARDAELDVHLDAYELLADWSSEDQFDPMCGCKLNYPDSAGARK